MKANTRSGGRSQALQRSSERVQQLLGERAIRREGYTFDGAGCALLGQCLDLLHECLQQMPDLGGAFSSQLRILAGGRLLHPSDQVGQRYDSGLPGGPLHRLTPAEGGD